MSMLKEFKEFAMRGNVVDMAVGIVIGAAFGKIVTSLVSDIIMPPLGLLTEGALNFSEYQIVLRKAAEEGGKDLVWKYGSFITSVVDFIIVAFAIFMVVKLMNRLKRKEEAAPPPAPPPEIVLLTEIRDELKAR
ncbi:MAG: large-conductance mechanosensitive channel protein MscL [Pirellulales bacterium]